MRFHWLRQLAKRPPAARLSLAERYPEHEIGRHTYGPLTIRNDGDPATVRIGAFTSIASGVVIFTGGEHRTDWVTTFPFNVLWPEGRGITGHPRTRGDVHVGNDVWLGADAMIRSGVSIGDGAVVGARSVVTHDVPPYAVVVGSPAHQVSVRFDDEVVARLLRLRWWDWPDPQIAAALPALLSEDIRGFLDRAERGDFPSSADATRLPAP